MRGAAVLDGMPGADSVRIEPLKFLFHPRLGVQKAPNHDADLFVADLSLEQLEDGFQPVFAHLLGRLGDALCDGFVDPGRRIGDCFVLDEVREIAARCGDGAAYLLRDLGRAEALAFFLGSVRVDG